MSSSPRAARHGPQAAEGSRDPQKANTWAQLGHDPSSSPPRPLFPPPAPAPHSPARPVAQPTAGAPAPRRSSGTPTGCSLRRLSFCSFANITSPLHLEHVPPPPAPQPREATATPEAPRSRARNSRSLPGRRALRVRGAGCRGPDRASLPVPKHAGAASWASVSFTVGASAPESRASGDSAARWHTPPWSAAGPDPAAAPAGTVGGKPCSAGVGVGGGGKEAGALSLVAANNGCSTLGRCGF